MVNTNVKLSLFAINAVKNINLRVREIWSIYCTICILSFAVFPFSSPANAAGPTNEEESIADLNSGRYPLAISPDGRWRVHVNEKNILRREDISQKEPAGEVSLPITVRALSVSQEARKVVVTDGHCVGLLSFDNPSSTPASGVLSGEIAIKWFGDEKKVCQNTNDNLPSPASRTYEAHSIAIAKSGKFIALKGRSLIKILDANTGHIASIIPVGGVHWLNPTVVLNMQFVDDDKKLFVVHAVLGEQWESEAWGSDMQFAIWDLQKGELFNFYNTKTTGTLLSDDLYWSFSEQTGKLWAINTNGHAWDDKQLAPIRPYAINLKKCGTKNVHQLTLPHTDWIDFSSDPFGRWIAIVESVYIKQTETIGSNLIVRNSVDGSVLLQRAFNSEIRIKASQDGEVLYAVASGQPASHRYTRITWDYKGGGNVVEVSLGETIKGLAADSVVAWPATRCQIEDETSNARSVAIDDRNRPLLFEHSLKPAVENAQAFAGADRCTGDQPPEFGVVSWGGNGKKLWIDRNTSLEQINLEDGRVEKKIPTPRTSSRCALPVFDREEYVVWEGDTISLLPFDGGDGKTKILVKKKGWLALNLKWFGNHFGVRWIKRGDQEEGAEVESEGDVEHFDALATLYDMSGKQLQEVGGSLTNGNETFFPGEEDGVEPFDYRGGVDPLGTRANLSAHYEWLPSYAGSVRAKYFDAKGNSKTVFWDGLDTFNPLTCNTDANLAGGEFRALRGGMGIKIQPKAISLFDAENRLRISGFSVSNPVQAEWFPDNHVLVVAEYIRSYGMNEIKNPLLRAYSVKTTAASPRESEKPVITSSENYCELIGQEYHVPDDYQPPSVDGTGESSRNEAGPSESNNSMEMEKSKVTNQKSEGSDWINTFQVYWKIVEYWVYGFAVLMLVIAGRFIRRKQI